MDNLLPDMTDEEIRMWSVDAALRLLKPHQPATPAATLDVAKAFFLYVKNKRAEILEFEGGKA